MTAVRSAICRRATAIASGSTITRLSGTWRPAKTTSGSREPHGREEPAAVAGEGASPPSLWSGLLKPSSRIRRAVWSEKTSASGVRRRHSRCTAGPARPTKPPWFAQYSSLRHSSHSHITRVPEAVSATRTARSEKKG
jgi:hypothetical protein